MTRSQLLSALVELSIPNSAFSLDGPGTGECYCLEADGGGWIIYYSERGQRHSISRFLTEDEANERFLAKLKRAFRR